MVDAVREVRPPFNFFEAVGTVLLPLCKAYHIYQVVGDNYAGELAKGPVRKAGISFELAEKHKRWVRPDSTPLRGRCWLRRGIRRCRSWRSSTLR